MRSSTLYKVGTKGGRALHADDAHSEAKAGHDPHYELDAESGPGFLGIQSAGCMPQGCRVQGALIEGSTVSGSEIRVSGVREFETSTMNTVPKRSQGLELSIQGAFFEDQSVGGNVRGWYSGIEFGIYG